MSEYLQNERLDADPWLTGKQPEIGCRVGPISDNRMTTVAAEGRQASEFAVIFVENRRPAWQ
jgi:hypothetical protein